MAKIFLDCCDIIKALSDPTRLEIIAMLAKGELCACKILENFSITQPTLSYHMKSLSECGLVNARREGAWMRYSLNPERFQALAASINDFCNSISDQKSDECNCGKQDF